MSSPFCTQPLSVLYLCPLHSVLNPSPYCAYGLSVLIYALSILYLSPFRTVLMDSPSCTYALSILYLTPLCPVFMASPSCTFVVSVLYSCLLRPVPILRSHLARATFIGRININDHDMIYFYDDIVVGIYINDHDMIHIYDDIVDIRSHFGSSPAFLPSARNNASGLTVRGTSIDGSPRRILRVFACRRGQLAAQNS